MRRKLPKRKSTKVQFHLVINILERKDKKNKKEKKEKKKKKAEDKYLVQDGM